MNLMNYPNALSVVAAIAILAGWGHSPATAQEETTEGSEGQARSIMSDPRLKNMLRTVKEESTEALNQLEDDPDAAVDRATRLCQESKDKIDPEKLKTAAAKLQDDGVMNKAITAVSSVAPMAAPAENVPATRPAPGISGGVPTPLAMPLNPGEIAPADVPAVSKNTAPANDTVMQAQDVAAIPGAAPTTPMIPDSPGLKPDTIPEPTPLKKKYEPASGGGGFKSDAVDRMEILSKESIMDNAKGILLFTGNVVVTHPEFQIKCDKIEIVLAEGVGMDSTKSKGSGPPIKRATASGGMVEIKRTTVEEGIKKTQIAIARSLNYNAVTQDITLSGGPPYIQDGDRFIKTNSEDAQIIMRGNGKYEITGSSSNRNQIVIPVPKSNGSNEGSGLGGGIGDALGGGFR